MTMAVCPSMKADDYSYLLIEGSDGSQTTVTAVGTVITFADGKMTVHSDGKETTFSLSDMGKMYFTNATGVKTLSLNQLSGEVDIYTTSGIHMGKYSSVSEARTQLGSGIYIVKAQDKTYKMTVK